MLPGAALSTLLCLVALHAHPEAGSGSAGIVAVMTLGALMLAGAFHERSRVGSGGSSLLAAILLAAAFALTWFGIPGASHPVAVPSRSLILLLPAAAMLMLGAWLVDLRLRAFVDAEDERIQLLADGSFDGILIHRDDRILCVNGRLLEMADASPDGMTALRPDEFLLAQAGGLRPGDGSLVAGRLVSRNGRRMPVEMLSRCIDHRGRPAILTVVRNAADRHQAEEQLRHLALHDPLTDLPNRRHLEQALEQSLRVARRENGRIGLFCLNLDGFKAVNDMLGHDAGDLLLRQVAARLQDCCRESDLVARIGGDEFAVLLQTGCESIATTNLAERIVAVLSRPYDLDGTRAMIGVSIGIAFYPADGATTALLLRNADVALCRAKEKGRGQFCLFELGMDIALQEKRLLEQELRLALSTETLFLNYQPLCGTDGRIIGFEALIRWNHPERGAIGPDRFIPIAEETGLILPIGEWVLRTACRAAASWMGEHRIAVNLSPAQVQRGELPALVRSVLDETGLNPSRLELEVTEGVLIEDAEHTLAVLTQLRALGVRIVLDDFGTGYSSLGYLHSFPFDKLKIDRSFINKIEQDGASRTIVDAIIAMSHKLRLEVTAEGIETAEQFVMLRDNGCDEMQGYLLGRPMPEMQLEQFVREQPARSAGLEMAEQA